MHKLDQEWHQHVLAGRWALAYYAFLKRSRLGSGLNGLYEYATHPARKDLLVPALVRSMVVDPIDFGPEAGDWTLSQGVAFQIRLGGSGYYQLEHRVFEHCVTNLWLRKTPVWVCDRVGTLTTFLKFLQDRFNGDETDANKWEWGPTSLVAASICQTFWVRGDTKGRDFDTLLGKPLDIAWVEAMKTEILGEFHSSIDQVIDEYACDSLEQFEEEPGLHFLRTDRGEVIAGLKTALELTNPLDIYNGFRRQKLFDAMQRTMLQVAHNPQVMSSVVDLCPHADGSIDGISWKVLAAPTREMLVRLMWSEERGQGVLERMPAGLADASWQPFLNAWHFCSSGMLWRQDSRLAEGLADVVNGNSDGSPVIALVAVQEYLHFDDSWHPKAREWLKPFLDRPLDGVMFRVHDVLPHGMVSSLTSALVQQLMEELAARVIRQAEEDHTDEQEFDEAFARHPLPALVVIPEWHDGRLVTREQAAFGLQGMRIANSVDDWPEGLERSFNPEESLSTENNDAIRGPAHMLRCGLGTWIQQALSDYGQQLVSKVLLEGSPLALGKSQMIGPILDGLTVEDSLSIGQVFGCEHMSTAWGWEFSWGVAFALGGAKHAVVEVRPSLQERLDHTLVDNDVPGWTLQGPSELTYVQFGYPIIVGTEMSGGRQRTRSVFGAYIWSREFSDEKPTGKTRDQIEDATIDLSLAIVGVDEFEGRATDRYPGGYSLKYFQQFKWQDLDAKIPLNKMIAQLSQSLENARVEDAHDPLLHRDDNSEVSDLEEKRLDEVTFEKTMHALAKVLLYMGLREARMETDDKVYGNNVGRGAHPLLEPRSNENKAKLERTKNKVTVLHKIRLGPLRFDDAEDVDDVDKATSGEGGGATKRPHYREGHFRVQAYGPGWRDKRRIWIKPQLIGKKNLLGGPPRLYDVG